ncbi:MAG: hypothetical protein K6E33_02160 [Lachnospiraceae bacterium]|nr:hypothetical protein [Lachnospiraceae bacterium]
MLDQEKIVSMARLSSYEENEGRADIATGMFFRGDYVGLHVVRSVICATAAFFIIVGLYVLYDFEKLMSDLYSVDLTVFAQMLLRRYIIFIAVYAVISYIVYSVKWARSRKRLKGYYKSLKYMGRKYYMEDEY